MILPSMIFKVVTAGDGDVGKTTMLQVYVEGKFSFDTKMTIGSDIFHKKLTIKEGNTVSLQLWDFGGQKRFRFLLDKFVKGASGAFLMYDLTSQDSFNNLPEWVSIIRKFDPNIPILLLGSKYDLKDSIKVDNENALEFVEEFKLSGFYKTSSKTGYNINEVFEILTHLMIDYKGLAAVNKSIQI